MGKLKFGSIAIILLLGVLYSCGGDSKDMPNQEVIPSNLTLNIEIVGANQNIPYGDGLGQIKCTATATNAVKYGFKFNNGVEQKSTDGKIDFTFDEGGINEHSITAIAYSETNNSINILKSAKVFFSGKSLKLVWSDEFDTDGAPDSAKWTYDLGTGNNGWGNNEDQTYTHNSENVIVEGGSLKITAKSDGNGGYTSSRLKTENLQEFTFGRVEVRAKLPSTQGTWPAIWMLGANFDTVGWPTCGEIDIMEQTGNAKNEVLGTLHWNHNGSNASAGSKTSIANADSEFHDYALEWRENKVFIMLDDVVFYEFDNLGSLPFNKDFFIILNVAMGGTLGGDIDPGFTEDTLEIEYVRIYQ
ncbi:glycoside hydrolase family 16 protein [Aureibaculum conchae]|uniref:glycoside hydrolase family 16 protein n=1 Tax=Aureibaculum sp. 2308TA14-22 TaxID=3108392 RepID=UPI003395A6B0